MNKFVIGVRKAQSTSKDINNHFYEGKVLLGNVKVGDHARVICDYSPDDTKEIPIGGLSVDNKIVDEVSEGSFCKVKIGYSPNFYATVITNDMTLLGNSCIIEFDNKDELDAFFDKRLYVQFPEMGSMPIVAQTGDVILNDGEHPQIDLYILYWTYLYAGQEIKLKLDDLEISCRVVKVTKTFSDVLNDVSSEEDEDDEDDIEKNEENIKHDETPKTEECIREFTMQEIADKLGINVKQLRIKA